MPDITDSKIFFTRVFYLALYVGGPVCTLTFQGGSSQKNTLYVILGVLSEKLLSGNSLYLEDVLDPPEDPDGDHDG